MFIIMPQRKKGKIKMQNGIHICKKVWYYMVEKKYFFKIKNTYKYMEEKTK